jgi:tetratricopeptide (TPR) repeat protein
MKNQRIVVIATCKDPMPQYIADHIRSVAEQTVPPSQHVICFADSLTLPTIRSLDYAKNLILKEYSEEQGYRLLSVGRKPSLQNLFEQLNGAHVFSSDIIVWLDGTDRLANRYALARVLAEYTNDPTVLCTYGNFVGSRGSQSNLIAYSSQALIQAKIRDEPWTASHLRTFRALLFQNIKREDLLKSTAFEKEEWFDRCTDWAVMYPILEMAGPRASFIPDILVEYNEDDMHPTLEPYEVEQGKMIKAKSPYQRLAVDPSCFWDKSDLDDAKERPYIVTTMLVGDDCDNTSIMRSLKTLSKDTTVVIVSTGKTAFELQSNRHIVIRWPWQNDFAAARNECLDIAQRMGATWCLSIDSDEELHLPEGWIARLKKLEEYDVVVTQDETKTYLRNTFQRVPSTLRFTGKTHEYLIRHATKALLSGAWVKETPKSEAADLQKYLRDREYIQAELDTHPKEARWHFYMGGAHCYVHEWKEASDSFGAAYAFYSEPAERAWAAYQLGSLHIKQKNYQLALDWFVKAFLEDAGRPEIFARIAQCFRMLGKMSQAVFFAQLATNLPIPMGYAVTDPIWQRVGAWEVLEAVMTDNGQERQAAVARAEKEKAMKEPHVAAILKRQMR